MRHQLRQRLGPQADVIDVASAGVRAMVGEPLDRHSAQVLAGFGGDDAGFAARQLEVSMVEDADLVLVATRKHRSTTARLLPSAMGRTFTIREFGRLAMQVDPLALPEALLDERLRAVVRAAAALRGTVRKDGPGEDDVSDPYGGPPKGHAEAGEVIAAALTPVADLLAVAVDPSRAPAVAAAHEQRRAQARTGPTSSAKAARGRSRAKPPSPWARAVVPVIVFGLLLAVPAVLGYQALTARAELTAGKREVARLKEAALAGEAATARARLDVLQGHAGSARRKLDGPLWSLAERLPALGDDVVAARTVARTVDDLSRDVVPPLLAVLDAVDPKELRVKGNQIAVRPLLDARPNLAKAEAGAQRADQALAAVPVTGLTGSVHGELASLRGQVAELADLTGKASAAADILPALLGADGKKTYFLAFQNNAEARGTGGLLGAYGILEAVDGRVRVTRLGSNQELDNPPRMPVNLGKDFRALYGNDARLWINANLSPHFPYAARIWLALWQRQHNQRLDGVIATDPVVMGYVLHATGPVRLAGGEQVTGANAAQLTMRDVYARYPTVADNDRRDEYLQRIAGAVFEQALSGRSSPRALVRALARAAGERRLLVYSADPALQKKLAAHPVAGIVPDGPAPYVGITVNSAVPSKLDYYLERSIRYTSSTCTATYRRSRVTATFRNAAPSRGLPQYVAFPPNQRPKALRGTPRGTNYVFVDVATTSASGLVRASVDGRRTRVIAAAERGHPVFRYKLVLEPGQKRTLVFDLQEPIATGQPTVLRQPLVRPLTVTQQLRRC